MSNHDKIKNSGILPEELKDRFLEDFAKNLEEELDMEIESKKELFRRSLFIEIQEDNRLLT